jgi:uncharacterized protein DUF5681
MESQQMEEEGNMGNVGEVGEVGFKRPPVQSRFRKGSSGNPKGRPRGTKNLRTDLTEVLQERITVTEGDRKKRMSKQRAIVMTLVTKTLRGDLRSANTLLNTMFRTLGNADAADDVEQPLDANEQELLAAIEARRQWKAEPATQPAVQPDKSGSQPDFEPDKSGSQS